MRLVDDFLFVTEDASLVKRFDDLMTGGISPYNCHVNRRKTRRNYTISDGGDVLRSNDSKCIHIELPHHNRVIDVTTKVYYFTVGMIAIINNPVPRNVENYVGKSK